MVIDDGFQYLHLCVKIVNLIESSTVEKKKDDCKMVFYLKIELSCELVKIILLRYKFSIKPLPEWVSVDSDLRHHMTSLGHSELTLGLRVRPMSQTANELMIQLLCKL